MIIAIAIDACAVNVLEHQKGLAGWGNTGIEQLRNMRVTQCGEHAALASEALLGGLTDQSGVQQFDGDLTFELAIGATCAPDTAHAAATDCRLDNVGTETSSGEARFVGQFCSRFGCARQKLPVRLASAGGQDAFELGANCGMFALQRR